MVILLLHYPLSRCAIVRVVTTLPKRYIFEINLFSLLAFNNSRTGVVKCFRALFCRLFFVLDSGHIIAPQGVISCVCGNVLPKRYQGNIKSFNW